MIKFVVAKPFKKIQRKPSFIATNKKKISKGFHFFSIKIIRTIFFVFAAIYGSFFLLKTTIFGHQYTIKRVLYSSGDTSRYDSPYLYKLINSRIKGENYYVVNRYKGRVLDDVRTQFPMVTNITVDYSSTNTVLVNLEFRPIDLVIRNENMRYGLLGEDMFIIYSGNKISNGVHILDLPLYMSGVKAMSGLFFRQPATGLVAQVEYLYQSFPNLQRLEYLPGGERTILYLEGKRFYINNLGDLPNQVRNYQLLKKYYTNYKNLVDIDLGSLEKDKVIVRKAN